MLGHAAGVVVEQPEVLQVLAGVRVLPEQEAGAQAIGVGVEQPEVLQVLAGVKVLLEQEAGAQAIEVGVEQLAVAALHVPAGVKMLPEHEAAPQDMGVGVGQTSDDALHVAAGTKDAPMHIAPAQTVPVFFAHKPPDAHKPVLPQFMPVAAGQRESVLPAVLAVHMPSDPERLQAMQAPVHAVLQHTPSTQLAAPLTQSALVLHMAPWACFVPQTCVTVLQVTPAQSVSVSQVVRHCVAFRHL